MAQTVEELEAQLAAHRSSAQAEIEAARARITELNNEAKGHRLNSDKHKADTEAATKARDDAIAEAARKATETEAEKAAAVTAAEAKAAEAAQKAQERVVNADLKIAAKDAGAHDAGDILALLDRSKIKLTDDGEISNAAELIADLKKTKGHLFGAISTSNPTNPPPPKPPGAKGVKDMTEAEFEAARRNRSWRA